MIALESLKRVAFFSREEKQLGTRSKTIMEQVQYKNQQNPLPASKDSHSGQALFVGGKRVLSPALVNNLTKA